MSRRRAEATAKSRAYRTLHEAIAFGVLPRAATKSCQVCGESAKHWHHHSYLPEHHLAVVALCIPCHSAVHFGKIPEPLTGELRTGARRRTAGNPWVSDGSALFAVFHAYPRNPPFMNGTRRRQVEAFCDAKFPPWRALLQYRSRGPVQARWGWRVMCAKFLHLRGSFLPTAEPIEPDLVLA